MRKLIVAVIICAVALAACVNSETDTTINADGSGKMVATVDLSEMMKMMAGQKKGEDFALDTVIALRSFSDTAKSLTARQKELVRDMTIAIVMDVRDIEKLKFKVGVTAPFKSLQDFNELNAFMKQKEYDAIFDNAMKLPMFDNKEKEGGNENDNIFASVFPSFYNCQYTANSINCKLDKAGYDEALQELSKSDFDINGEMENQMLGEATFTNKITLPRAPKNITGTSWKKGSTANELVQTGKLLDLYKSPEKYEYSIQY
jgi:hypothetical protein